MQGALPQYPLILFRQVNNVIIILSLWQPLTEVSIAQAMPQTVGVKELFITL
jgi:hypothetical protein